MSTQACLARVEGHPLTVLPSDLFIPPDALEVLLDQFEGPLDLLLYLIRKQKIEMTQIPMALITEQYLHYIERMEASRMTLAAEYLVMAAVLIEIKSRLLLPKPLHAGLEEDIDPRAALVERLQTYEQFKASAQRLDALDRRDRDVFLVCFSTPMVQVQPKVTVLDLHTALLQLVKRTPKPMLQQMIQETHTVDDSMQSILQWLKKESSFEWRTFKPALVGRQGWIIVFLALLELTRQSLIQLTQAEQYGALYVSVRGEANG